VDAVLEDCLTRVPKAQAVVCVALERREMIAAAFSEGDHETPDPGHLARSACDLFDGVHVSATPAEATQDPVSEALIAGAEVALIFLRCKTRPAALAYVVARDNDLGLALASSRLTLAAIEAEL
jgi:hypothetical protein